MDLEPSSWRALLKDRKTLKRPTALHCGGNFLCSSTDFYYFFKLLLKGIFKKDWHRFHIRRQFAGNWVSSNTQLACISVKKKKGGEAASDHTFSQLVFF